jgi:hypothetical protein
MFGSITIRKYSSGTYGITCKLVESTECRGFSLSFLLKKDNIVGIAEGESLCEDGSVSLDVSNSGWMISLSNGI